MKTAILKDKPHRADRASRRRHAVVAMVLLLTGCGAAESAEDVYDLPLDEVTARLARADLNGFRYARQCGILIHINNVSAGRSDRRFTISSSGRPVLSFTVRLTSVGNGQTRATIEVPLDPSGGEMYDGDKVYLRPALNQPLRPAVRELIDSAVALRPYDVTRLPEPRNMDSACSVQRGGLESGLHFRVDDEAGMDAGESARHRSEEDADADRELNPANAGAPMDDGTGGY